MRQHPEPRRKHPGLVRAKRRKDFEMRFYEGILKERPDCVNVLIPLGDAYTRKGLHQEGLAIDERLVRLRPHDPIVHYNLACSLSLVGKTKEALRLLKKAILLGYDDFAHLDKDADLDNLRSLPEFKAFYLKLKRIKK